MFDDVSPQKSLQNLQDASDDLMMLDDDALLVPYQIGEVFISHTQEETQEMLEAAKVSSEMHDSALLSQNLLLFNYLVVDMFSWIYALSFSTFKCVIQTYRTFLFSSGSPGAGGQSHRAASVRHPAGVGRPESASLRQIW